MGEDPTATQPWTHRDGPSIAHYILSGFKAMIAAPLGLTSDADDREFVKAVVALAEEREFWRSKALTIAEEFLGHADTALRETLDALGVPAEVGDPR